MTPVSNEIDHAEAHGRIDHHLEAIEKSLDGLQVSHDKHANYVESEFKSIEKRLDVIDLHVCSSDWPKGTARTEQETYTAFGLTKKEIIFGVIVIKLLGLQALGLSGLLSGGQ